MISLSCLALFSLARHSTWYEWLHQPVYLVTAFFVLAVLIVPAFFALAGHNWARWLLAISLALNVGTAVLTQKPISALGARALPLIAVAYYLFRPSANAFFCGPIARRDHLPRVQETPPP
jgi:hypothetical protein